MGQTCNWLTLGTGSPSQGMVEMSVAGLRFGSDRSTAPLETKSGSYIYHGDAARYHDWEFRTLLRIKLFDSKKEVESSPQLKQGFHLTRAQAAKMEELQPLLQPLLVQALKGMTLAETCDSD